MSTRYAATVIQFLSNRSASLLTSVAGRVAADIRPGLHLSLDLRVGGLARRPWFAMPWPQHPSIGPYEFVDPYGEIRWPTYLAGQAAFTVTEDNRTANFFMDAVFGLRQIVFNSFKTKPSLRALPGETLNVPGYRLQYWNELTDFDGNPIPTSREHYNPSSGGEPLGPGFIVLRGCSFDLNGRTWHDLNFVWSQSVSLAQVTDRATDLPRIRSRVRELKRHWNSFREISDARQHVQHSEPKAAVRAAASATEAAIRFYASEWGVAFKGPTKKSATYVEKIDHTLVRAGRPAFYSVDPDSARTLLDLYHARSSMHDGDCVYQDQTTGIEVVVRNPEATKLVEASERFICWLDTQA